MANLMKPLLGVAVVIPVAALMYQFTRPVTADGLAQLAKGGSFGAIEKALASEDTDDQVKAVEALVKVQSDQAIAVLQKAVEKGGTTIRVAVLRQIPNLPPGKVGPVILALLEKGEFGVVRDTLAALGKVTGSTYAYTHDLKAEQKTAVLERAKKDIEGLK